MDLQTLENEVMAWRLRFPKHEYNPQDDCVALKFECSYGCHCDLDQGMKPDKCVLDEGRPFDCTKAQQLLRDGKARNDCDEWKPIIERPNVEVRGTCAASCASSPAP